MPQLRMAAPGHSRRNMTFVIASRAPDRARRRV